MAKRSERHTVGELTGVVFRSRAVVAAGQRLVVCDKEATGHRVTARRRRHCSFVKVV
jgi:hypothetical protein